MRRQTYRAASVGRPVLKQAAGLATVWRLRGRHAGQPAHDVNPFRFHGRFQQAIGTQWRISRAYARADALPQLQMNRVYGCTCRCARTPCSLSLPILAQARKQPAHRLGEAGYHGLLVSRRHSAVTASLRNGVMGANGQTGTSSYIASDMLGCLIVVPLPRWPILGTARENARDDTRLVVFDHIWHPAISL
jgi:hypothetical protein